MPGCLAHREDGTLLVAIAEGVGRLDPASGALSAALPFETDRPGHRSNDGKAGPDAAPPVAEAVARETAAAIASRDAADIADAIAARTFAAASERGVEPSSDGNDVKSAAVGGECEAKRRLKPRCSFPWR